ncbi:exodeoxyribonuclease V subunit gamma [Candidatus Vondammii sp. HM_W22]|uniref:exodeoxyribonuclease V subunit gamma n=1 Tax=Candidatus Vondammii sp. HM_W22 TaxID=2687299 RepID=UPI002E7BB8CC|nr:exodeoxyribonuclease V subunit gamma [Candidatus Vondammii sp. HM_W22]
MGLQLISSNKMESLVKKLAHRLINPRLTSAFSTELIIAPSPAMARWVNLQLAQHQGIAANIHYPLPASWIWEITASLLDGVPDSDPLDHHSSSWKIFGLLPGMLELTAFSSLSHYLQDDSKGLKRWQLSARIADVFDRYQFYRPDLIRKWDQGDDNDWQAHLWRELATAHQETHRVAVLDRLLETLRRSQSGALLPKRISLFAISTLPPLFVDVLHALSEHTQVDLYQFSPTDQYWADLKNKKELARKRLVTPDEATYYETGNELLASWGRQGQALQDLLLNDGELFSAEWEEYQAPEADSLLSSVQQDIFSLNEQTLQTTADNSVQVHICHSALRECQVLHDRLLTILQEDPSLKPEDTLVMVPEISRYAPYIEAVFRKEETQSRPFIPWNLSDISISGEHPLIRIFFQLLSLPQSRFTVSEVLSYLDVPELTARFNLNDEACNHVRTLLEKANVRWGVDGAHKAELDLPAIIENTWKQAEQRLFAGYSLGDVDYWNGIAPLAEAEGAKAESLGSFWMLFSRLQEYRQRLGKTQSADEWQQLLNQLLDSFFSDRTDEEGKLQQIRDSIDELQQQASRHELSPELLHHWLNTELGNQTIHGRYFSGGVTFCSMRPMRSLPFRIICLLGMNDQAFPRRERPIEFDRMADSWRPGDPGKGDEDRYLLLETLLCTRQTLYISYTGRDLKDNSEQQPSVLVRELLDFIDDRYSPVDKERWKISNQITTLHPLQPFSRRNYQNESASYDRYWYEVAKSLAHPSRNPSLESWPSEKLEPPEQKSREIELQRLSRFIQHPVKFFFNTRLNVWLKDEMVSEDEELFALDGLQSWQLKSLFSDNYLQGRQTRLEVLQAKGMLPHGIFSETTFNEIQENIAPLLENLTDYAGIDAQPILINIPFDHGFRLSGQVDRYLPGKGVFHYTPSKLKGKHLLALWLDHLALCASGQFIEGEKSTLITNDTTWQVQTIATDIAKSSLQQYLEYYWEGLQRPLPVFPNASYLMATKPSGVETAWNGFPFRNIPGDKDDSYIQLALRGFDTNPVEHPEFTELSAIFYQQALQCGETL